MAGPRDDRDDQHAFEEAMSDVSPLERDQHPPQIRYRLPTAISEHEREVLRELDALVAGVGEHEIGDPTERHEGKVPGLDPRVMKQLRRGQLAVQADLDLHGSDAETARGLVERFVLDARQRDLRCVRIVHGRGRNSPDGVSVLKTSLPRWLARGPARHVVLAYTTAAGHDGGAGATYVLLRRQR